MNIWKTCFQLSLASQTKMMESCKAYDENFDKWNATLLYGCPMIYLSTLYSGNTRCSGVLFDFKFFVHHFVELILLICFGMFRLVPTFLAMLGKAINPHIMCTQKDSSSISFQYTTLHLTWQYVSGGLFYIYNFRTSSFSDLKSNSFASLQNCTFLSYFWKCLFGSLKDFCVGTKRIFCFSRFCSSSCSWIIFIPNPSVLCCLWLVFYMVDFYTLTCIP